MLLLLVPFLNPMLKGLKKDSFQKLIFVMLFLCSVIGTIATDKVWKFSDLDFFLVMYVIGAYIRLYIKKLPERRKLAAVAVVFLALMILSVLALDALGVVTGQGVFFDKAVYFNKWNSVLAVGLAVFVFCFFLDLEFYNEILNKIASATLGIYLIHNNFIFRRWLWQEFYPNPDYIYFPYIQFGMKVVLCYCGCLLLEFVRSATIGRWVDHWLTRHYDSLWNCLSRMSRSAMRLMGRFINGEKASVILERETSASDTETKD